MDQLKLGRGDRPPPRNNTYTVTQLVRQASRRLESHFADVWVEGEVSNLSRPRSGHLYFTLKDRQAQVSVVIFRSAAARLRFDLRAGLSIRCRGRLGIYDARGQFQLTADTAEPVGEGALQAAFERLKAKLEAEGLFQQQHKKPLPALPRTVAVVTSQTAAALQDFIRVAHQRCPVRVVVCPTGVQGEGVAMDVVDALRRADALGADVIVVTRGGGSLEDLQAFNNEGVARAIFAARTPVVSAVGHEVDVTIADMVADLRAPTPSGAAELVLPVMAELGQRLAVERTRLQRSVANRLDRSNLNLERLRGRLGTPGDVINRARMGLDDRLGSLEAAMARHLRDRRRLLDRLGGGLSAHEPRARLARDRGALQELSSRLTVAARRGLDQRRSRLGREAGRLQALSPLAVLSRGYTVVLDGQRELVRRVEQLAAGDRVAVRFHDGDARCLVEKVEDGER